MNALDLIEDGRLRRWLGGRPQLSSSGAVVISRDMLFAHAKIAMRVWGEKISEHDRATLEGFLINAGWGRYPVAQGEGDERFEIWSSPARINEGVEHG